ncbi:MAG: GNAT family N-acetyltransferase [Oscillospiraceae bacterium]|nr:GNAT family N-acetyltransferase [Oscillospiraceae bacterium]
MLQFMEWHGNQITAAQSAAFSDMDPLFFQTLQQITPDTGAVFVILDGDLLLGLAAIERCQLQNSNAVRLCGVTVHPQYRRQGLARTLLSLAAGKAMEFGAYLLYTHAPQTAIAQMFCAAVGFVQDTKDPAYLMLDLTDTKGMRHGG